MKRSVKLWAFGVALGLVLVALIGTDTAFADGALACNCTCYFSSDCSGTGRGTTCDRTTGCTQRNKPDESIMGVLICGSPVGQPKCDGDCRSTLRAGATWDNVKREQVAEALDLYFQAYLSSGLHGGGGPDPALLQRARELPLSADWHQEILGAVHNALDVILGWDFIPPQAAAVVPICVTPLGQVPTLSKVPAALIEAARQGLVEAIRNDDPMVVVEPIVSVWSKNSEQWHPLHTGRCYPHGHPEFTSTEECQVAELQAMATFLLAK